MYTTIRIILLLQSPIAATPYHAKIKSYSSSDKKEKKKSHLSFGRILTQAMNHSEFR